MANSDIPDDSRKKVGDCVILNYEVYEKHMRLHERKGSGHDADRLAHDFRELDFNVHRPPPNLTRAETLNVLKEACKYAPKISEYFVCCILTHGDNADRLATKDRWLDMDEFLCHFYPTSGFLIKIPKIFIIQACCGGETEKVLHRESTNSGESTDSVILNFKLHPDFIIIRSTYPGKLSFKTTDQGSYFIQELCNCLEYFSKDLDLFQIITVVNYRMANFFVSFSENRALSGSGQMPYFVSTLRSQVLFQKYIKPFESEGRQRFYERRASFRPNLSPEKYPYLDLKAYDCSAAQNVEFFQIIIKKGSPNELKGAVADLSVYMSEKYSEQKMCDLKKSEIKLEIKLFARKAANANCTICFFATPSKGEYLCDKSGRKISKKDIIEAFVEAQHSFLVGKPKVFIFLMCESKAAKESPDGGSEDIEDELDSFITAQHADILEIMLSIKNPKLLTGLMVKFVNHLKEYGKSENLLSILTMFNSMLCKDCNFQAENPRSTFSFNSTLTKKLFLP